jgi:phage terminase Nu1 subunit (DNA packaging protein)
MTRPQPVYRIGHTPTRVSSVAKLCAEVGVSNTSVKEWLKQGMPSHKEGSALRFSLIEVGQWIGWRDAALAWEAKNREDGKRRAATSRSEDEDEEGADYWSVELKKEQTEKLRLANAKSRAEMVSREEVLENTLLLLKSVMDGFAPVPERIAILGAKQSPDRLRAIATERINEALAGIREKLEGLLDE